MSSSDLTPPASSALSFLLCLFAHGSFFPACSLPPSGTIDSVSLLASFRSPRCPCAILDAIGRLRLDPDIAIKSVSSDLLPHKLLSPSCLLSRDYTTLTPAHQPRLSQCSPILRYFWREQRFFFLQDADRLISALEIFWGFGVRVKELSFLGRGGGMGGWVGGRRWRGRGGEDGGGEIGGNGGFAGGSG